jgi:hypothetical protein
LVEYRLIDSLAGAGDIFVGQDWLLEILIGTGKLFLHPVFYILFFLAAYLGVSRVKRERRNFHVRVENAYFELRQLIPYGLVVGLILSIIIIAVGIVIPLEAVAFIGIVTLLICLTTKIRFLSPAYTLGLAFAFMLLAGWQNWTIPFFPQEQLNDQIYPSFAVLLALLLVGEGILIIWNGTKGTSPKLIAGKRGLRVGAHEVKRAWMLPVFLLIPGDVLQQPFEWWPVLSIGSETYSLLLVPFAIGFHQQVQAMLPREAIRMHGKRVIALGVVIALIAAAGYFIPLAAIGAFVFAFFGRAAVAWSQRARERNLPFYFSKRNNGLMILGILLDSPASKMSLKVGEIISKANGQSVRDEKGFYEALQRNRAHCKLEVLDVNGEVRFEQRALYEGDHHELGILFVQDEKKWDNEVKNA